MAEEQRLMAEAGAPSRMSRQVGQAGLRVYGGQLYEEYDADLRGMRGIRTFEEMRRGDPTIAAGLRAITWILQQVNWSVQPGGQTPADKEAAEFLESCMHDMSLTWSKFIRDALTCLPFGWSWLEITYKLRNGGDADPPSRYDDGRIGWRKMTLIGHESLSRWDFDESGGVQGLVQEGQALNGKYVGEVTIPIEKSILFRLEDEKGSPEGVSLLRPVVKPWYIKTQLQEVEAIGIERDLTGVLIIHLPGGATNADFEKARDLLEQYKADDMTGFIAPQFGAQDHERWRFEIISSPGSKAIEPGRVIQRYQVEIARSFLAQFLMLGQDSSGSWALGRDMRDMFELALGAILMNFEETINRFLVPPLFRLNDFGTLTALPEIRAGKVSKTDTDKFAAALSTLATAGLLTAERSLEDFIRQEMDLPELPEDFEPAQPEVPEEETGQDEDAVPGDDASIEEETGQGEPKQESEPYRLHGGAHSGHTGRHGGQAKSKGYKPKPERTPGDGGGAGSGGGGGGAPTKDTAKAKSKGGAGIKAEGEAATLVNELPSQAREAAAAAGLKEVRVLNDRDYNKAVGGGMARTEVGEYRTDTGVLLLRKKQSNLRETFYHEFAHTLDPLNKEDVKFKLSENAAWLKASGWKEGKKRGKYTLRSTIYNRPVSEYGKSSPWEDFAETFTKTVTGSRFDRRVMEGESEGRYAYMKKYAQELGFVVE